MEECLQGSSGTSGAPARPQMLGPGTPPQACTVLPYSLCSSSYRTQLRHPLPWAFSEPPGCVGQQPAQSTGVGCSPCISSQPAVSLSVIWVSSLPGSEHPRGRAAPSPTLILELGTRPGTEWVPNRQLLHGRTEAWMADVRKQLCKGL